MRIMFLNQAPKKSSHYDAAAIEAQLNSYASPGTKVEIAFPDDYEGAQLFDSIGSQSMLNGLHHMMEVPSIVRKIFWAAQNGYDAVISSNTFDPGVDGGRLAVEIPGDRAFAHLHARRLHARRPGGHHGAARPARALHLAHPAHLRPRPFRHRHPADRRLRQGRGSVGRTRFSTSPKGLSAGWSTRPAQKSSCRSAARSFPTWSNPDDLAKATGVQVLNTKAIGIRFAEMCVAFGMTQSAITYPRAKLSSDDFEKPAQA